MALGEILVERRFAGPTIWWDHVRQNAAWAKRHCFAVVVVRNKVRQSYILRTV